MKPGGSSKKRNAPSAQVRNSATATDSLRRSGRLRATW